MREFSAKQLKEYLEDHSPVLLDVRQPWEYDVCHIEPSILIPMSQVPHKLDELGRDDEIVVICHHGIRSRMIGQFLESSGFSNIINLSGGVDEWAKQIDPMMSTY